MSLSQALGFTLKEEGGYVDNPNDEGGPTNHGITQATYDDYRKSHGLQVQPVNLITDSEVEDIYAYIYWAPAKCQLLPERLGICHFDWSVNHGLSGAMETLQRALGVTADGIWGSQTAAAVSLADEMAVVTEYNSLRRAWYRNRVMEKPNQAEFLPGWLKRVDQLDAYVEAL